MKNFDTAFVSITAQNSASPGMGHATSEVAERIGRTIAYMTQHLDQPLQVAALAAQASVSPSHYFALFKRQTGCAPIDYFIRLRMERARQLLDSTSSSVKEVAAVLGYNDPFYFSRLFKSVNRVAPSEYRQLQRNSKGGKCSPNEAPERVRAEEPLKIGASAEFLVTGRGYEAAKKYQFA